MRAKSEVAFGDPNASVEERPKGFLQSLMRRPSKYRFVAIAPDDPRHPCYLPEGADGVERNVQWLEIRINEGDNTESRFALIDCRPSWEQEHGVTVVLRNGSPVAVSDYQVNCESFESV